MSSKPKNKAPEPGIFQARESRSILISFRVTPTENEALKAAAGNRTVVDIIREAIALFMEKSKER